MIEDIRVGTGGWAYFQVPGMDSLEAYARAFNYVEVNTTFYQIPPLGMVRRWRQRVPEDFLFAVRCHRSVTHAHAFDPTDQVVDTLETMGKIAGLLKAEALHLQTPATFAYEAPDIARLGGLLDAAVLPGIPLALEPRAYAEAPLPPALQALMADRGLLHCVDLSKADPAVESPVLYTRLFGKGYHTVYQFSDEELEAIHDRGQGKPYRRALFTFHGVRMYADAGRFLSYVRTGGFPSARAPDQSTLF